MTNWFNKGCIVYLACPMTGFDKQEMIELAKHAVTVCRLYGLNAWSPVLHEEISGKGNLDNSKSDLDWKWPMDLKALNESFVFINLRADEKSFGCEDEYGRHRYSEWQPVVRISPKHVAGYTSIANYQTDLIAPDIESAARIVKELWGSRYQRILWKLKIFNRSYLKWHFRQLRRLFQ